MDWTRKCGLCLGLGILYLTGVLSLEPQYRGPHVAVRGHPFTIECRLSAFDFPKWTKDGIPLSEEGDYELNEEGQDKYDVLLTLTVGQAEPEHAGEYRCNSFSRKSHRIALQDADEDDDPGKEDNSVELKVGKPIHIVCDLPISSGAFPIFWFKNYVKILPGKDPDIIIRGNKLTIKNAQESDAGEYLCTKQDVKSLSKPAVSSPDDVIGHITVVKYPSRVEDFPSKMSYMEGTDLKLECKVHGAPVPRVMWLIGNVPAALVDETEDRLELSPNADGLPDTVLTLTNLTFDDRNLYTCRAENSLNADESSVFIAVWEGKVHTNANETYEGVLLEKDKPLELQCNVTGEDGTNNAMFAIQWIKDGKYLEETDPVFLISLENYTLKVEKPKEGEHTGNYTCVLKRDPEMYSASIFVKTKAHVTPFPKSINLVQGDTLSLKCIYGGVPQPAIRWFKDDMSLNDSDHRVNISSGEADKPYLMYSLLKVSDLDFDDRGTYKCEADNGLNESPVSTSILIRVKDKLAALWPFLGICVEVAILCTIIFVYEKKRVKPDFEEPEADQNTDNKNVHDQKEGPQDVRLRK